MDNNTEFIRVMHAESAANFWISLNRTRGLTLKQILQDFGLNVPESVSREAAIKLLRNRLLETRD